MKKTYTLSLDKSFGDSFYREQVTKSAMVVCEDFVKYLGIKSLKIKFSVSTVRPHKKGWVCARIGHTPLIVLIGKERKKFVTLYVHRDLFSEYKTKIGWVKVESV